MENDQLDQNQQAPGAPFPPAPVLPIPNAAPVDQSQAAPSALPVAAPPAPAPTKFIDRLHQNVNEAAAATPPAAQGKPGSWARQLIMGALKSLPSVVSGVENSLSDSAVAAQGALPGEGVISAIGRVKAAQNARLQQAEKFQTEQDRERALTGKINVDSHYQEMLLHSLQGQVSDKANAESLQNGLSAVQMATAGAAAYGLPSAQTVAADIGEKELHQAIVNKTFDPTTMTFWHTKTVPSYDPATGKTRLDADGNPLQEKRYTIITNPQEVVLSADQAKFLNDNLGTKWQEGQHFPGPVGLAQFQQASNAHAMRAKIESDRKDAELADLTRDQKLASLQAEKNLGPDFFHILSQSGSLENTMNFITGQHKVMGIDPTTGQPGMITDTRSADYAAKHAGAGQDLVNLYGGLKSFQERVDKENEDARNARDKKDPLAKLETDPAEMTGDKSVAAKALLQTMRNSPDTDPNQIPRIDRLIRQADVAATNYQTFKQTEAENKEKVADGNPEDMAQMLVEGLVPPSQIISSRKPAFAQKAFQAAQNYAEAHGQPDWSSSQAEAQYKYASNPQTQNTLNMVSSMTTPGGSIDIVKGAIDKFPKVDLKVANQVFNPIATQFGSQAVTDFHVAMLGLADEFSKIMGQGGGSDASRQQALDILKDSYSKGQLASGLEILRREVQARGKQTTRNNPTLKRMYPEIDSFNLVTQTGQTSLKPQAVAGVPHRVVIGGKIVGYTSDGGKTMTTTAPAGSPAVGTQVQ
jgi:hypothetical protein